MNTFQMQFFLLAPLLTLYLNEKTGYLFTVCLLAWYMSTSSEKNLYRSYIDFFVGKVIFFAITHQVRIIVISNDNENQETFKKLRVLALPNH